MFDELDAVPWASMEHAYGPAEEVPELLRGLISADEDEREIALDGFYGAVHHQGDVYDCTRAAIPFLLEIVADGGVPGRDGALELLGSIGSSGDAAATPRSRRRRPSSSGCSATPIREFAGARCGRSPPAGRARPRSSPRCDCGCRTNRTRTSGGPSSRSGTASAGTAAGRPTSSTARTTPAPG